MSTNPNPNRQQQLNYNCLALPPLRWSVAYCPPLAPGPGPGPGLATLAAGIKKSTLQSRLSASSIHGALTQYHAPGTRPASGTRPTAAPRPTAGTRPAAAVQPPSIDEEDVEEIRRNVAQEGLEYMLEALGYGLAGLTPADVANIMLSFLTSQQVYQDEQDGDEYFDDGMGQGGGDAPRHKEASSPHTPSAGFPNLATPVTPATPATPDASTSVRISLNAVHPNQLAFELDMSTFNGEVVVDKIKNGWSLVQFFKLFTVGNKFGRPARPEFLDRCDFAQVPGLRIGKLVKIPLDLSGCEEDIVAKKANYERALTALQERAPQQDKVDEQMVNRRDHDRPPYPQRRCGYDMSTSR